MHPKSAVPYLAEQCDVAEDFVNRIRTLVDENNEVDNFVDELFRYGLEGSVKVASLMDC